MTLHAEDFHKKCTTSNNHLVMINLQNNAKCITKNITLYSLEHYDLNFVSTVCVSHMHVCVCLSVYVLNKCVQVTVKTSNCQIL